MNSRFAIAVHVLTFLALAGDEPTTSEYIAGSVNTNPVVIRRILSALRQAGLVTAQPGIGGGSSLARPAAEITLADVYRATEERDLFALHPRSLPCDAGRERTRRRRRHRLRRVARLRPALRLGPSQ